MLSKAAENHYYDISESIRANYAMQYMSNIMTTASIEGEIYTKLVDIFEDDSDVMNSFGINLLKRRLSELAAGNNSKIVDRFVATIQKYDPEYVKPAKFDVQDVPNTSNTNTDKNVNNTQKSGGCYVATAVYGSYDCPEVWTLRRYRDYTLAETWYGRMFIRTYYAISPTLVKWFGHTKWFKKMWQGKLDKMVAKLQSEGVKSTPYEDRKW